MSFVTKGIAGFVHRVGATDLDGYNADRLKRYLLDAIGCALAALGTRPVVASCGLIDEFGGTRLATVTRGGRTAQMSGARE